MPTSVKSINFQHDTIYQDKCIFEMQIIYILTFSISHRGVLDVFLFLFLFFIEIFVFFLT